MPVISTASLKKGSQTVLGAYRGATPAYNARSFYRDFAQLKTLNHGVGPNITFSRGSQATYFTADGTLRFAPHNAIRNSEAVGATNGVIWSPSAFVGAGSIPQWASFRNFGSMEVVGSGTELGIRYVDIKISGTNADPVNAGSQIIGFNAFDNCVASSGQTWTSSASIRLVDGSLTNVLLVYLAMQGRQADTTSTEVGTTTFTPSSTYQRVVATKAMTNASTARVSPDLTVLVAPSSTVNFTLRIAAPQLERNATPSDYIPTTGTANFDQPRFDHSGGTSLGLLIEGDRTNLLASSKTFSGFSGGGWTSVTDNHSASPDGTTTASLFAWSVVANSYKIGSTTITNTAAATYTTTAFVKPVSGTGVIGVRVGRNDGSQFVESQLNLQTNANTSLTVGADVSGAVVSAQSVGNGWYRLSATGTFSNSYANFGANINAASGSGSCLAWGVQLEQGAFPTSYIPTTTAAVTRLADSAVVDPISGFYNQAEGTFITATNKSPLSGSFPTIWHLTNGTDDTGNIIGFYNPSNSTISYNAPPAFSFAESVSAGLAVSGFAFSANLARMAVNGVLEPSTDQSATITTDKAALRLGAKRNGSEPLNGHIRRIAYFPRRLSNALLQQLTT